MTVFLHLVEAGSGLVALSGELTAREVWALTHRLNELLDAGHLRVVDLSGIEHIEVEGVAVVVYAQRRARSRNATIRVQCRPGRPAARMMDRLGLDYSDHTVSGSSDSV